MAHYIYYIAKSRKDIDPPTSGEMNFHFRMYRESPSGPDYVEHKRRITVDPPVAAPSPAKRLRKIHVYLKKGNSPNIDLNVDYIFKENKTDPEEQMYIDVRGEVVFHLDPDIRDVTFQAKPINHSDPDDLVYDDMPAEDPID